MDILSNTPAHEEQFSNHNHYNTMQVSILNYKKSGLTAPTSGEDRGTPNKESKNRSGRHTL